MPQSRPDERRRELARIHILAGNAGMSTRHGDDDAYRDMLWAVARVRSASELDQPGRQRVLDHLARLVRKQRYPGRPHNIDTGDRGPLLRRIEALLTAADRQWPYADGIAKKMFHVDRVALCGPDQLHKIVAALMIDARRRKSKVST